MHLLLPSSRPQFTDIIKTITRKKKKITRCIGYYVQRAVEQRMNESPRAIPFDLLWNRVSESAIEAVAFFRGVDAWSG